MDTLYRSGFIGDQIILTLPLKNADGTAFTPGGDYALIFTAKNYDTDTDADAIIQLTTGAGIVHSTSNAICTIHPAATTDLRARTLVFDIQAQHVVTGEVVKTAAHGNLRLVRDVTRLAVTSIPVVTTGPPLPIGGGSGSMDQAAITAAITNKATFASGNNLATAGHDHAGVYQPVGSYVTLTGVETLSNKAITGTFTGNLTGNVTGNVTGTVSGSSGSTTGNAATVTGLSITAGKTLAASNTITLAGTDGSTLTIGTGGTLGTAAFSATTAFAPSRESVTAGAATAKQAVAGARYIVTGSGLAVMLDPTTGLATGQSYTVIVGGGSVRWADSAATTTVVSGSVYVVVSGTDHPGAGSTVAGTVYTANATRAITTSTVQLVSGTSYLPSRFEVIRYYNGTIWSTLAPTVSDTLTVGTTTWDGTTFAVNAISASAQGTPSTNTLMTMGLSDARYATTGANTTITSLAPSTNGGRIGFGKAQPTTGARYVFQSADDVTTTPIVRVESNNTNAAVQITWDGFYASTGGSFAMGVGTTKYARIFASGGIAFGVTLNDPGANTFSFENNVIIYGAFRLTTSTTPASAAAAGVAGTICWDANYIYVCTATNTWKRTAIATW